VRRWLPDVLAGVGAALVTAGLWLISPPAGLIGAGVVLIGAGILGAKAWTT
jgi:hypothetical protein